MNELHKRLLLEAFRVRRVEERIMELYPSDAIQSPVHLSIGQELHTVALMSLLKTSDRVFATYRSHAAYIAKGGSLQSMFAELFGKQSGIAGGKAGSMHLCHPQTGLMGSSAIVGAVFSHALGAAYADKITKSGNVVVCITGEGATEEGTFHECLNFAALKQVPVVYVIEDNGLAINIPVQKRQSYSLRKLADAYSISYYEIVDCFDMDQVINFIGNAVNEARMDHKPSIVQITTYRYKEHVGTNCDHHCSHRDKIIYEKWINRDPLINNKELFQEHLKDIEREIDEAIQFARDGKFACHADLLKDVY
ncbi:MAG: thiamine pyrophosphate-dependent dehydrogenase E1 component subunit alpha [Syntrophobacteraceae bacterium]